MAKIISVLLEYSISQKRVIVRAASEGDGQRLPVLEEGNFQNLVKVFDGVDMGFNVGFAGLVPDEENES